MMNTNDITKKELTGYPSIDRPWLKYYPSEFINDREKHTSIFNALSSVWTEGSDVMIDYYENFITVKDFFSAIDNIANALKCFGLKEGDSIVVSLELVPEFIELLLACERLGITLRSYIGDVKNTTALLNQYSVKLYIVYDYISGTEIEEIYHASSVQHIILVNPLFSAGGNCDIRQSIVTNIKSRYPKDDISSNIKNIDWGAFISSQACDYPYELSKENILYSAFTSGTTGSPKEVLHTSKSILGIINQFVRPHSDNKKHETWLTNLPPTLVAATVSMMLCPLSDGKRLILDPYANVDDLDLEMMYYEPNYWGMTPSFFEVLLSSKRIPEDYDMNYFKMIGFGAELVNRKFVNRAGIFLKKHNCKAPLCGGYGQSEGGSVFTTCVGEEMLITGSAGIPFVDTVISAFDSETSEELKYNQIGEICKCGPGLMTGYGNVSSDDILVRHLDGEIWLHTGDYGFITEEGLLYVIGRSKINVFPDKTTYAVIIENKLSMVEGIRDLIVVEGKDYNHEGFKLPYLFVIGEENYSEEQLIEKIKKYSHEFLLPEEIPAKIFVIDQKPIYHFKTDRKALQTRFNLI